MLMVFKVPVKIKSYVTEIELMVKMWNGNIVVYCFQEYYVSTT